MSKSICRFTFGRKYVVLSRNVSTTSFQGNTCKNFRVHQWLLRMPFTKISMASRILQQPASKQVSSFIQICRRIQTGRNFSSTAMERSNDDSTSSHNNDDGNINYENGPYGSLFHTTNRDVLTLVGKTAYIRRTFNPRSNAQALLICGGPDLARHASFDPQYNRARQWIHSHPVGPAVVGPVLIGGLIQALVEASIPHSVPVSNSVKFHRPLIVGVKVEAKITVESLAPTDLTYQYDSFENSSPSKLSEERHHKGEQKRIFNDDENGEKSDNKCRAGGGYEVSLRTEARRVRDGAVIAEGTHSVWLPDYMQM